MSSYIRYEVLLFFQSVLTGAVLLLFYGFLTSLRQVLPHHPAVVACEDLVYWTAAGLAVFSQIYRYNQGILRSFLFLGLFAGAGLCRATVSPLFVRILAAIWRIPIFFIKFSTNRLLFLVRRCKIFLNKYLYCRIRVGRDRILGLKRGKQVENVKKQGSRKQN